VTVPLLKTRQVLADELALAIVADGPRSGSSLSIAIGARKGTVLDELKSNPRFECLGRGRGARWRLAGNRNDPRGEPMGTDSVGRLAEDAIADRLARVERRPAAIEHRLDDPEDER
jgi:hypothetical protein